jgi:putative membrane protein
MSTLTILAAAEPFMRDGAHHWDGPPFPFFLFPLFWLLLLGGVVLWVALGRRRRDRAAGRMAGERVLAERYAAGAIDEAEFRSRQAVLRDKR